MLGSPFRNKYQVLAEQEHSSHTRHLKQAKSFMKFETPPNYSHLRKRPVDFMRSLQINHENLKIKTRINELMKSKSSNDLKSFRHASLNRDFRSKEQLRIERENENFNKRLKLTNSNYPLKHFLDQRRDNERYIKTRCVYPNAPLLNTKKSEPELVHTEEKTIGETTYNFKVYRLAT